jgi:hypothetical protein
MTALSQPIFDAAPRVEFCRDADVPALMRFIGSQWHPDHVLSRDETLLRWQFAPERLQGQRAPGPTVMLAWLEGEIIGMLGLTGFEFNVLGERYPAMWLSQWLATPAHRRHNVGLSLIWAARDLRLDAVATLGANAFTAQLLARLGLELIPSLSRWVGVFDVAAAAELVCGANPTLSLPAAAALCRTHVVQQPTGAKAMDGLRAVEWSTDTAAAWDRCWSGVLARRFVGACRDAAYVTWRYVSHPRFEYQLRCAQRASDGAVEGIAVWRVERVRDRATWVLRIVEFLGSPAAEAVLAQSVLEGARDSGAALGDFYCASARAAEVLARIGFQRAPAAPGGVVFPSRFQPLESQHFPMTTLVRLPGAWRGRMRELLDEGRLYITKSDGDQDRPA